MKEIVIGFFKQMGLSVSKYSETKATERTDYLRLKRIFEKYKSYTMIPELVYIDNLALAEQTTALNGDVVECGVWKGGMIAGIADTLGAKKQYWLFDSFEGLPEATAIDGNAAVNWQKNTTGRFYYNNCSAEEGEARAAMEKSPAQQVQFVKGWFKDTVQNTPITSISLLRLDGDWYESTYTCLEAFYPKVVNGGCILIDDYYQWEGCAKAVHDYLSKNQLSDRIHQSKHGVAYIIKNKPINEVI